MTRNLITAAMLAVLLGACSNSTTPEVPAQEVTTEAVTPEAEAVTEAADYSNADNWLCLPEKAGADACAVDLTSTTVNAGNEAPLTVTETFAAAEDPAIDCFYVYPTVSTDDSGNSDLIANEAELRVVNVQFARFAEACRLYAPMYRQVTMKGLRERMMGITDSYDEQIGYQDVKAAWDYYMEHENNGRGVILVGHSQGARMIQFLLQNDIIGKPSQDVLISAMPIGFTFPVDKATQTFEGMPLCTSKDQTGCMISYASFRNDSPPPATSRFGYVEEEGMQAACVNPGDLTGDGVLKPYLSNVVDGGGNAPAFAGPDVEVTTPYASLPGLLTAECVEDGNHTYLAITTNGDPADPRTDRIAGDVYILGNVAKDWGMHLGDMHLAMGNLIEIAKAEGAAWEAKQDN